MPPNDIFTVSISLESVMTLVIAWRSEDMLTVCADTRIWNGESPITDAGQKIFQVPVEITPFGLDATPIQRPSVGFAFAGNTLMAQSCCAIASTCLASLAAESADVALTPDSIVSYFAKAAEYVLGERRFLTPGTSAAFQAIVFGWDEVEQSPFIYDVSTTDEDGRPVAVAVRAMLSIGGIGYFGSGSQFLSKALEELEEERPLGKVRPHRLMEAAIASAQIQSVGGSLQFATAARTGVRLRPFMRVADNGAAEITVLGCNVGRLMDVAAPFPGAGAVALPESDK